MEVIVVWALSVYSKVGGKVHSHVGTPFSHVGGRVFALTTAEDNVIREIITVFIVVIFDCLIC